MTMKNAFLRLIAVVTALLLAVLLVACGAKTPAEQTMPSTEAADSTQTDPTTATGDPEAEMGIGQRGDYEDEGNPSAEATKPTESQNQTEEQPEATQPEATQPEDTQPAAPEETQPEGEQKVTFAQYVAMSEQEQEAFVASFPSLRAFMDWWNAAKAEEEAEEPIIVDDGVIDLGQLINP